MLKKVSKFIFILVALVAADLLALFFFNYYQDNNSANNNLDIADKLSVKSAKVLGEADEVGEKSSVFSSENFRIEQLGLGGGFSDQIISLEGDAPLKIYDVTSEVLSAKDDPKKTYLAVSWKTNKSTQNELNYSKKGESAAKNIRESDFSLMHTVILPDLDADSVYEYSLMSRDRFGNEKKSDRYIAYSGAPVASLVDVLQGAAEKVFGWAIKK